MRNDTALWRHAHPNFMDGETITSQVFFPFPKDDGNLSVDDGDKISAVEAYEFYTERRGLKAHSTWAVTMNEAEDAGTPGKEDALEDAPWHALLNFNDLPQKSWRKAAKKLKRFAIERGCQYFPQS